MQKYQENSKNRRRHRKRFDYHADSKAARLRKGIDSYERCIYIHGTAEEHLIGRPASHGCIRMRNRDIIELFALVPGGTLVKIVRRWKMVDRG